MFRLETAITGINGSGLTLHVALGGEAAAGDYETALTKTFWS
jgi:hypothetical protein